MFFYAEFPFPSTKFARDHEDFLAAWRTAWIEERVQLMLGAGPLMQLAPTGIDKITGRGLQAMYERRKRILFETVF